MTDIFSYRQYMQSVDVSKLIKENTVFDDHQNAIEAFVCMMCNNRSSVGIILNNGQCVCESCFRFICKIRYPEKYQKLYEEYLVTRAAWKMAYDDLMQNHSRIKQKKQVEEKCKIAHSHYAMALGLLIVLSPIFMILTIYISWVLCFVILDLPGNKLSSLSGVFG